ncbi:hypothetical protein [Ornithobacterium rhinotracheale]
MFTQLFETTKFSGKFLPKKFWFVVSAMFSIGFIRGAKVEKVFVLSKKDL